jgi:hypothetical protein
MGAARDALVSAGTGVRSADAKLRRKREKSDGMGGELRVLIQKKRRLKACAFSKFRLDTTTN